MGTLINFPGHHMYRCPPSCKGCCICEGGLFLCTRCGGAEGSLPTDCPGHEMGEAEHDAIMGNRMDYDLRRGGWVVGPRQYRRRKQQ